MVRGFLALALLALATVEATNRGTTAPPPTTTPIPTTPEPTTPKPTTPEPTTPIPTTQAPTTQARTTLPPVTTPAPSKDKYLVTVNATCGAESLNLVCVEKPKNLPNTPSTKLYEASYLKADGVKMDILIGKKGSPLKPSLVPLKPAPPAQGLPHPEATSDVKTDVLKLDAKDVKSVDKVSSDAKVNSTDVKVDSSDVKSVDKVSSDAKINATDVKVDASEVKDKESLVLSYGSKPNATSDDKDLIAPAVNKTVIKKNPNRSQGIHSFGERPKADSEVVKSDDKPLVSTFDVKINATGFEPRTKNSTLDVKDVVKSNLTDDVKNNKTLISTFDLKQHDDVAAAVKNVSDLLRLNVTASELTKEHKVTFDVKKHEESAVLTKVDLLHPKEPSEDLKDAEKPAFVKVPLPFPVPAPAKKESSEDLKDAEKPTLVKVPLPFPVPAPAKKENELKVEASRF